ncbi:MAG: hypothetical protein M5U34_45920 [Chloroflexi bacterium]|nr:hypothetical protein [Chloroflexota bacterium]
MVRGETAVEQAIIRKQLESGLNSIPTSSMGRLFDAAAALAGIRQTVSYEAQAAIEFESLVDPEVTASYTFNILTTDFADFADFSPRPPRSPRTNPFTIDPIPYSPNSSTMCKTASKQLS